ncbi:NADH-quinone oxidoreductase, partial [Verrucomicrobia bacterium]|nr:NADH-quinone oxidoreductase [Verrucomicrobiota bacterium]
PPRPEALIHAFMTLQRQIDAQSLTGPDRPRHLQDDAVSEFPVPKFGAKDLYPSSNPNTWTPPQPSRKG